MRVRYVGPVVSGSLSDSEYPVGDPEPPLASSALPRDEIEPAKLAALEAARPFGPAGAAPAAESSTSTSSTDDSGPKADGVDGQTLLTPVAQPAYALYGSTSAGTIVLGNNNVFQLVDTQRRLSAGNYQTFLARSRTNLMVAAANPVGYWSQCADHEERIDEWYSVLPVGEYHSYLDMSGWFAYGEFANTEFGVAVSSSGSGGWSLRGTTTVKNGDSADFKIFHGSFYGHHQNTNFRFGKYKWSKICPFFTDTEYTIEAERWMGGFWEGRDVSRWDGGAQWHEATDAHPQYDCPYPAHAEFHRHVNRGFTYSGDVQAFGVGLTARSDYGANVDMFWKMGSGGFTHDLFGYRGSCTTDTNVYAW